MIVNDRPSWIRLIFSVKGSGLNVTAPRVAVVTGVAVVVTALDALLTDYNVAAFELTSIPFSLLGVALGIFLSFRNSAAYDRFWEGRKLWGQLTNVTRSLARQVVTLLPPANRDELSEFDRGQRERALVEFRRDFVNRLIAYAHSLRHHLRDTDPLPDLAGLVPPDEVAAWQGERNLTLAQINALARRVSFAWREGWISEYHVPLFEASLAELTAVQGGCERIKVTPIPFAYTVFIHRIVAAYCLFLPLGIVRDVHYMTPLVVLLISYAFLGLDELGDEIEDPFGIEPNDLPLAAMSRTIEVNLRELLGEQDVPELLKPQDGVLL